MNSKKFLNIKGAVLDKYQLENYLEKFASDNMLKKNSDKQTYPIPRLDDNFKFITKTYEILNNHMKLKINIHPAGEWLLDNYYIIEETYKNIKKEMTLKKYKSFPGLSNGSYKGFARVYVIAAQIVGATDGKIDDANLKDFITAYQRKKTLNMEEIWNISVFFYISIIEHIRDVCEKIYYSQIQKYKVESLIERLVESKDTSSQKFKYHFVNSNSSIQPNQMKNTFIEYLSYKLKLYGRQAMPYLRILEEQVEKIGSSISEIIKKEHFDIALNKVTIGNCIKSIKDLQRTNFLEIFEKINGVEEILKNDPAGVYNKMDNKTKDYYRNKIKELSKKTKTSEIYVATKALELSEKENQKQVKTKKTHIGYFLIGDGIENLKNSLGQKQNNKIKNKERMYVGTILLISSLITLLTGIYIILKTNRLIISIIEMLLIFIPIIQIVMDVMQYILNKTIKSKIIPKLDFTQGIPNEYKTMVVIPTILKSAKQVEEMMKKLEVYYLGNKSDNIYFTLLGDCSSSDKINEDFDKEVIQKGIEISEKLNKKYPDEEFNKFNFIYRKRSWNQSEKCYLGWERKRGLLTQFNEYLLGNIKDIFYANTIKQQIPKIKYIITLDADTELVLESGLKLVGAMAHILNEPVIDKEKNIVIDGYGILQPRVGVNLNICVKSLFTKIFAGLGGTDLYTNAISDIYQDNFGEGIYTGKGIYNLEVFSKVLKNVIPENTVLSHDLLEGIYLRCGLASDIMLLDGYPTKYNSFISRLHRWIRGDWQIIRWLKSKIKDKDGKIINNPINEISKFKIIDNLRRSLLETNIVLEIIFIEITKIIFNINLNYLTLIVLISIFITPILDIINYIVFKKQGMEKQYNFARNISGIKGSILRAVISLSLLPYKAYISLDAIIRTLYRMYKSKQNLLEWTTSDESERNAESSLKSYYKAISVNLIIGIFSFIIACKYISEFFWLYILSILWILAPLTAWYISINLNKVQHISKKDEEYILDIARRTWSFFEEYINEQNNYLPPDNYQEDRVKKVVDRTSSTNIGLGVMCVISAYDLRFIEKGKALELIKNMLITIEKLSKWNGHLYNWYNIKTLEPLKPNYVSTVDSGNFVGYMYVLKSFLKQIYMEESDENKYEINNMINSVSTIINNTDFSYLYDKKKRLLSIGFNTEENKLTDSYYDLLASEARQASLIAIAKKDIPVEHWHNLSRTLTLLNRFKGLISWSGTAFEYLMPNINIIKYPGSLLDESCKFMIMSQKKYCEKLGIPWGISESAFNLKDLNNNYQYKAFGIPWLGLKRGLADEMVVSSYGTILAIGDDTKGVLKNLKRLQDLGMYNKYGFYEAIDYTPARIPINKDNVIVKTYMAHHQALILLSINNLINNNILPKRFMDNPQIQSIDILLQERMPDNVIITKNKKEKVQKIKYLGYNNYSIREYKDINRDLNISNVISNEKYTVCVNDFGLGFSKYKDILINRFKRTDETNQGILFYIKNTRTKKIWTNTYTNLGKKPDKYKIEFSPDMDMFKRIDENIQTKTKIITDPNDAIEIRNIKIKNNGNFEEILEVTGVLEPVLSTQGQDYAHKAFNNLFLKYEIAENKDYLIIKRNDRNGKDIYLGVNLFASVDTLGELEFEINKEKLYGRLEHNIPRKIEKSEPFSNNIGLVTDPIIALKKTVSIKPEEEIELNLVIAVSESKQVVENNIREYKNEEKVKRTFELSKVRTEEEARYLRVSGDDIIEYQRLLSYLIFNNPLRSVYLKNIQNKNYLQSDLWKYGISGELPILLVKIKEISEIYVIENILKAYEYYRAKNINIELVVLNKEQNVYEKYVKDAIETQIQNNQIEYLKNTFGGIFIINSNEIEDEEMFTIRANFVIDATFGNIKDNIEELEEKYLKENKVRPEVIKPKDIDFKEEDIINIDMKNLKYYNGYGGFSEDGKEYIIKTSIENPTPLCWSHILSNKKFGTVVTESLGGYTWSKNSRLNRLTAWANDPIIDTPSEIIYIKDEETKEICTIGGKFTHYVKYGFGYAKYIQCNMGIIQEDEIFVPNEDSLKINLIKIKNTMPSSRRLKLVYYIKPVLDEDEIKSDGYIEAKKEFNYMYAKKYFDRKENELLYISSNEQIKAYMSDKEKFFGEGDIYSPDYLYNNLDLKDSIGKSTCMVIEINIELNAYEEKEIYFALGVEEDTEKIKDILIKYKNIDKCKEELNKVKQYWNNLIRKLQVNTPVESTNILLNGWAVYQTIVSRMWARSGYYQSGGAFGFRDQLQDTLGLKYIDTQIMKNQIIKHASHQFIEGDVLHWWHDETKRGIRTKFSDDLLWLVYVVCEYIEFTGDRSILDIEVPYLQGEKLGQDEDERYDLYEESNIKETIYKHCLKAIEKSLDFGKNGLPKIGSGDWNDGFSNVGNKGIGESVWLGFFLYNILDRFINILKYRNDEELVKKYEQIKIKLKKNLNTNGWDGSWFRRAFTDEGDILGSITNEECKIDNIAQSWSVISNAGDNDKKYIAMENMEKYLIDKEAGIIKLLTPPFEHGKINPGYIQKYLPGVRENGGQYTHGAIWSIIAFCILENAQKADEYFRLINPIEHSKTIDAVKIYKVEPYVVAADIYGSGNLLGRGGWTWYTGSSSWLYKAGIENILGLKIYNNIMEIKPCIPSDWKNYSIQYRYKSSLYNIKIENPNQKSTGITQLKINGEEIEDKKIRLIDNNKIYDVEVIM